MKTRTFQWSLTVIAAMAMLGCDAAPSDAVVRLKQVFAERVY